MAKCIALLRGINVSGRNLIPMAELRKAFAEQGFTDVATCLASGNVVFSTEQTNPDAIASGIAAMIRERFCLDIPVLILKPEKLESLLREAPPWWGSKDREIYDNLIFILPPTTFREVYEQIGPAKPEIEWICANTDAIYWSFVEKAYSKTNWIRTASSAINDRVTIRTANTVRKILELSRKP